MQDRSRTQIKVSYAEISQGETQNKKTVELWCCGEAFLADFLYGSKKNTFEEDHGTVALSLRTQAVVVKRITRKLNYILDNEIRLA